MTLRPRSVPLQVRRTTERKRRQDKSPGRTFASRPNRLSHKDSPGSHTPQHHSCFTRGRSAGATAPILSSRSSATLGAITRTVTVAFESAGRYTMRLVTSCITGRRPRTPAGAILQRAFRGVHADGQPTSRRPGPRAGNRREESTLHKDLPLQFCSQSDRGTTLIAIHHLCEDVVPHIGLCRQTADTNFDVASDTSPDTH